MLCVFPFFPPERLFGKAWREEFVVLYEDSSVIWFRDRDRLDPEGGIFLKDAPEMLAAGQVWILSQLFVKVLSYMENHHSSILVGYIDWPRLKQPTIETETAVRSDFSKTVPFCYIRIRCGEGSLDLVDLHGVGRPDWYRQGP